MGAVEKNNFIALPGKGGHSRLMPTVCLDLEGLVRTFIAMVQRQCDQLVDILLTGW